MKIAKKVWDFSELVSLPPVITKHKFLFWKWENVYNPTEYKYKNSSELLQVVNDFIKQHGIKNIISFKDTCKVVTYYYSDEDCYSSREENEGFIELVYWSNEE